MTAPDLEFCTNVNGGIMTPRITAMSCKGGDGAVALLVSGGAGPYVYIMNGTTNNSGIFAGLSAGSYTYKVVDSKGCQATGSVTLAATSPVTCNIKVKGCILGHDNTYLLFRGFGKQTIVMTAYARGGSGKYSYDWGTAGKKATIYVSPKKTTTYKVVITDSKGCKTTCSVTVCVIDLRFLFGHYTTTMSSDPVSSTGDIEETEHVVSRFNVYPNPASSYLNISYPVSNLLERTDIALFDMQGRLVITKRLGAASTHRVDISALKQGLYIVNIRSEGKIVGTTKLNVIR